jgi:hypothetical protein
MTHLSTTRSKTHTRVTMCRECPDTWAVGICLFIGPTEVRESRTNRTGLTVQFESRIGRGPGHPALPEGWRQISHFRTNAYLKLSRPSPAAPSWPTLG